METAIDRRSFLQHAYAAPLLISGWRQGAPGAYTDELSRLMRAAPVPGAVIGALHSRKLSWIAPLGVRAEGSADPIRASTLFQAASLTKQVTVHAAFALRAQGKLDFERTLVSYIDDLPNPAARAVTIRHVLSHGIYGLIQYSTAMRTHEIGIRMAVGAQAGGIFRMIIGEGLKLSLAGLVLGLVGALWLGRAGSSLLFGVTATDPWTFAAVSLLLTAVAAAACYFPARRAMKVEPMTALRQE